MTRAGRPLLAALLAAPLAGCASQTACHGGERFVELYETAPIETSLGAPGMPEAHALWLERIDAATTRIELEHFYASDVEGSRLEPVVAALGRAGARGVAVRFLASETFRARYPRTLERLASFAGVQVRTLDLGAVTGGTQHAKLMIVDGCEVAVGSHNFDWRALEHIQELGAWVRDPAVARAFERVFELDWALAADPARDPASIELPDPLPLPAVVAHGPGRKPDGAPAVRVTPVVSPAGLLPDPELWDLPRIVALLESAETDLRVQLLTYRPADRDGARFTELEDALVRAAGRGVRVRVLLSDWCKRAGTVEDVQGLAAVDGVEVRFVTLPEWSLGFVPFSRTVHAKLAVADADAVWIGTGNWERSYFEESRNLGLVLEGGGVAARVAAWFDATWNSSYADDVDPTATYEAPRIAE